MQKEQYRISIDAPREKVWNALWEDRNYRNWTSAFSPESRVETDNWKKGSKVRFTDGKGSGMLARIAENKANEFMSFEHYGQVIEGVEDTESEKVKEWAGAHENYTLQENNGKTELIVDMDVSDQWKEYFDKTWPVALGKVKELAEKN